jgi:hypothetical protein
VNKNVVKIFVSLLFIFAVGYFFLNDNSDEKVSTVDVAIHSLHPITVNSMIGFINQDGSVVIKPTFASISTMRGYGHDELIPVSKEKNGKVGYIDKTGEFVIQPSFHEAYPFQEGKALVVVENKVGYIDIEGNYIVEPTYSLHKFPSSQGIETLFFSEGMAAVQVEGKGWGYVNEKGSLVIEPQFNGALAFTEGLAPVKVDNLYGYIDKTGNIVIEPQYKRAYSFSEGLAAVKIENKYGFINEQGELVIEAKYEKAKPFQEGLAAVFNKLTINNGATTLGHVVGYVNTSGEEVIPVENNTDKRVDYSFHEGYALLLNSSGEYSLMNKNGENEAPIGPFTKIYPLSHGLVHAVVNQYEFYIDKSGEIVYRND